MNDSRGIKEYLAYVLLAIFGCKLILFARRELGENVKRTYLKSKSNCCALFEILQFLYCKLSNIYDSLRNFIYLYIYISNIFLVRNAD